jgi:heme-degrading monooxygenase HmoA
MRILLAALMLGAAAPTLAAPVAVLVAVPIPAGMPRPQLEAAFRAAVPEYQKLPGLIRKYFTIGDDGRAGGIYLWSSRAAAEAWYNDAWKDGVQKRWGAPATVSYFDVPALTDGVNPDGFRPDGFKPAK